MISFFENNELIAHYCRLEFSLCGSLGHKHNNNYSKMYNGALMWPAKSPFSLYCSLSVTEVSSLS